MRTGLIYGELCGGTGCDLTEVLSTNLNWELSKIMKKFLHGDKIKNKGLLRCERYGVVSGYKHMTKIYILPPSCILKLKVAGSSKTSVPIYTVSHSSRI